MIGFGFGFGVNEYTQSRLIILLLLWREHMYYTVAWLELEG